MRKNGRQMTAELRKRLEKIIENREQAETIVTVELLLWGYQKIHPEGKAQEAWALIPGYDEPILPNTQRALIARLRVLFPYFRNRQSWHDLVEEYQGIPLEYRLFAIDPEGHIHKVVPKMLLDREEVYQEILANPIPFQERERTFAEPGPFTYHKSLHGEVRVYKGQIPHFHDGEHKALQFPLYREKKRIGGEFPADWADLAKEMDQILGGDRFAHFVQGSEFVPLTEQKLQYEGNLHIAGGLGVGKSTFILLETYRLVKKHQAKVGILEGSVEGVLEKVKILRKLGIKAVPIIGKSNRKKHLQEYLYSVQNKLEDLSELQEEAAWELQYLSGKCILHALAQDYDGDQHYPCTSLLQEGQRQLLCPLYARCGVIRPELELVDADVWVATAPSVLKSRFSPMVDPYRRTYYEAMYHLLDVIFIDEADRVQMEFDQAFVGQYDLIGESDHLLGRLMHAIPPRVANNPELYSHALVSKWLTQFYYLQNTVNKVYHLLSRSASLQSELRNQIFHVYRILHDLSVKIWGEEYEKMDGYKILYEYVKEPLNQPVLSPLVDQLLKPIDRQSEKILLQRCLKEVSGEDKHYEDDPKLFQKLEFFLYLARIDDHFRYLIYNHLYVSHYLNLEREIGQMFRTTPRDYHSFIKDSMTGLLLGYRYLIPDGSRLGYFKLLEYNGVGRELLKDWHRMYEDADQRRGPAVVFLSGSSYAPGSHHFHIDLPVHWLLKAKSEKSTIEQRFRPVFDFVENRPLFVSGKKQTEERLLAIQKMVQRLKGTFAAELQYWKEEDRRILLVVNAYRDLEGIKAALQTDNTWKERYRLLTREKIEDEQFIPKRFIQEFAQENADILAVPLTAVGRGYNILHPDSGRSLFGTVFFLVRPYAVPGDMTYLIPALHGFLPDFLAEIRAKELTYEEGIKYLRHKSIVFLERMVRKPNYWTILGEDDRKILSWYTFILVWQMIGRLLRGGTRARVYYVDSKFAFNLSEDQNAEEISMLQSWKKMLQEIAQDPIVQELYGPFIETIVKIDEEVSADG
ncbi:hypothetical protein BSNK01_07960 [Bacillaceae bacterium]